MTYEEFKAEVLDKAFDIDNAYGAQCWDGAMYYSQRLGYPVFHCDDGTGYARDIWTARNRSGILEYYDEVEWLEPGDLTVFKEYPVYTPASHIAIFDHDAGNGFGVFLGQNQDEDRMSFCLATLPYAATYPTAFRPKCFAKQEPKGIYGLDLSEHNISPDWSRIAATNDFVILRAGYGWDMSQKDSKFDEFYNAAKAVKLKVGAYWYSYARSIDEARQEAECFKNVITGHELDFGVWVDLEDADHWKASNGAPSGQTQAACANEIARIMKEAGYTVGIYASTYPIDHEYDGLNTQDFMLWEANYGANDGKVHGDFSHRAVLHQYTSNWNLDGKIYDRNICYKDTFTDRPKHSAGGVHRLYKDGDHLYTTSFEEAEKCFKDGWTYEKIAWTAPNSGELVYRLFNDKYHTYAFKPEADELVKLGWKLEGPAFHSSGHHPIYRMYNPNSGEHVLTPDRNEHDALTRYGWHCEGQDFKY